MSWQLFMSAGFGSLIWVFPSYALCFVYVVSSSQRFGRTCKLRAVLASVSVYVCV